MEKVYKILIFTDLDATLLHRDTFKFEEIKDYIKQLISKGIFIIPNTSKTEKEILAFNNELLANSSTVSTPIYFTVFVFITLRNFFFFCFF